VISKLDLAVLAAAIAAGMLSIEHAGRIAADAPQAAELAASGAAVCPDNENLPYSADCIAFMQGGSRPDLRRPANAAHSGLAATARAVAGPACPAHNENAPYSSECLDFLSGWFWRPDSGDHRQAPADRAR
jgi:hypothetical protein